LCTRTLFGAGDRCRGQPLPKALADLKCEATTHLLLPDRQIRQLKGLIRADFVAFGLDCQIQAEPGEWLQCEVGKVGTEMFDVGDKVVHPAHGAGLVTGIKEQDFLEQYHRYYVIDLAVERRTLMVPVSKAEEIGLRSISQRAVLAQIWDTLGTAADPLSDDYKKRQKRVQERLKTGDAIKVAEVIRDLSARKRDDHLTSFDKKLLEKAQQFLACEVALAEGVQVSEAEQVIFETLDNGVGSAGAQGEEAAEEEAVAEAHQSFLPDHGMRRLAERVIKRLQPGYDNGTQKTPS
jgi:CarD family transcriptional regulator